MFFQSYALIPIEPKRQCIAALMCEVWLRSDSVSLSAQLEPISSDKRMEASINTYYPEHSNDARILLLSSLNEGDTQFDIGKGVRSTIRFEDLRALTFNREGDVVCSTLIVGGEQYRVCELSVERFWSLVSGKTFHVIWEVNVQRIDPAVLKQGLFSSEKEAIIYVQDAFASGRIDRISWMLVPGIRVHLIQDSNE